MRCIRDHLSTRLLPGVASGLLLATPVPGAALPPDRVPAPLRDFVDWVLHGREEETCPFLHAQGERSCFWPARLRLALGERGGRFEQQVRAEIETPVPLPGDARRWPLDVRVDGHSAPVLLEGGRPVVRLGAGEHRVEGRFTWSRLPELLPVPPETGLVALEIEGRRIPTPRRDARGRLWLKTRRTAPTDLREHAEIRVQRLLRDDIPLRLQTRIELRVSGPDRELRLGPVLPEGFEPVRLEGLLPMRLEPDRTLRVQARAGEFEIRLDARALGRPGAVAPPPGAAAGALFDPVEEWAFEARPELRLLEIEGALPLDAEQAELPPPWRRLPAYRLEAGRQLELVERRRGSEGAPGDDLTLHRTLVLDFSGSGATLIDRIEGELRRALRLEVRDPILLGRVRLHGAEQPITRLAGTDGGPGVEVSLGPLHLEADSRIEGPLRWFPATGWRTTFRSVETEIRVPPGWRLLHVLGADAAPGSWTSRWTLLDLFLAAIVSLAFFRLFGFGVGIVAALAMAMITPEAGAPVALWLAPLATEALRRLVPGGRLAGAIGVLRAVALAALLIAVTAFALEQVRIGLFPGLEDPARREADRGRAGMVPKAMKPLASTAIAPEEAPAEALDPAQRRSLARASAAPEPEQGPVYPVDPEARIATGPGRPGWHFETVPVVLSGPVGPEHELRLLWLPPAGGRAACLLRALLVVGLAACLLRGRLRPGGRRVGAPAAMLLLLLPAAPGTPAAGAEIPGPELLDELRARLLEPPACAPRCAGIDRLDLEVRPDGFRARLGVSALARTAIPLPGSAEGLSVDAVRLDGGVATGLRRDAAGTLWMRVEPGAHAVEITGSLPARDSIEIPLPLRPHHVSVTAPGFGVEGLHPDGTAAPVIRLVRHGGDSGARPEPQTAADIPPFARVVREFRLGLEWQATTRVERVAPPRGPIVVELPLLEGEAVTTPGIEVQGGRARVSLAPERTEVLFTSLLPVTQRIELRAAEEAPYVEEWRVDPSPRWHVDAEGLPYLDLPDSRGRRLRTWRPWPGERLTLQVTRPEPLLGATRTSDGSFLRVRPGPRGTDSSLRLTVRTTLGGTHRIGLPEGAEAISASVDGRRVLLRQEGREVVLPLHPGTQTLEIAFREPRGVATVFRTPALDLGTGGVDHRVRIDPPAGRWTLWTAGPLLGPAVLFWPVLLLVAAAAALLARVPHTPLGARAWFLLGAGLTQAPLPAAALVVVWLLALGWRRARGAALRSAALFDAVQIGLVLLTAAALVALALSIERGLLGLPEMQIAGNGSTAAALQWYQDRVGRIPAQPAVVSVPLLVYRLAMLAWALWIAAALLRWLRFGVESFTAGATWRSPRAELRARAGGGPPGPAPPEA